MGQGGGRGWEFWRGEGGPGQAGTAAADEAPGQGGQGSMWRTSAAAPAQHAILSQERPLPFGARSLPGPQHASAARPDPNPPARPPHAPRFAPPGCAGWKGSAAALGAVQPRYGSTRRRSREGCTRRGRSLRERAGQFDEYDGGRRACTQLSHRLHASITAQAGARRSVIRQGRCTADAQAAKGLPVHSCELPTKPETHGVAESPSNCVHPAAEPLRRLSWLLPGSLPAARCGGAAPRGRGLTLRAAPQPH